MKISAKDLINFETGIANYFNDSKIKAPVHLYSGNEKQIIKFFDKFNAIFLPIKPVAPNSKFFFYFSL